MKFLQKLNSNHLKKFIFRISSHPEKQSTENQSPRLMPQTVYKINQEIENAQKVTESLSQGVNQHKLDIAHEFIVGLPDLKSQLIKMKGPYKDTPEINEFITRIDFIIARLSLIHEFESKKLRK